MAEHAGNDDLEIDVTESESNGTGRRDLMKKAAIGGAALWVAPIVLSAPSAAASTGIYEQDWSEVPGTEDPPQINTFDNETITPTDWEATNSVDVVRPGFPTAAPWTTTRSWVDLVGTGSLPGSISYTIAPTPPLPDGNYRIRFQYGRYANGDNSSSISLTVNGSAPAGGNPLPLNAPQSTPQEFNQIFAITGGSITIVLTGIPHAANIGPAVGTAWVSHIT